MLGHVGNLCYLRFCAFDCGFRVRPERRDGRVNRHKPLTKADDIRETPPELYNPLDEEHQFQLDACATIANAKTPCFYTDSGYWCKGLFPVEPDGATRLRPETGLTGPWEGRVWCNPPFSEIPQWLAKCWRECARSARPGMTRKVQLIWFLIPATRTEQVWWHKLVEPYRDGRPSLVPGYRLETKNLEGRIHFLENGKPIMRKNEDGSLWINPKTGKPQRSSPKFGCVGLIWTPNPKE